MLFWTKPSSLSFLSPLFPQPAFQEKSSKVLKLILLGVGSCAPRPDVDRESWAIRCGLGGGERVEPGLFTAGCGNGWARRVPAASARSRTC